MTSSCLSRRCVRKECASARPSRRTNALRIASCPAPRLLSLISAFKLPFQQVRPRDPNHMDEASTGANDLLFDVRDGIGRATFNRPQARNAFTFPIYDQLSQIYEQANKHRSIKLPTFQLA